MDTEKAEEMSFKVLEWLASNETLFDDFLSTTGAQRKDVVELLQDSNFQISLFDFILQSDDVVLSCADSLQCQPTDFMHAKAALPGGEDVHWT